MPEFGLHGRQIAKFTNVIKTIDLIVAFGNLGEAEKLLTNKAKPHD